MPPSRRWLESKKRAGPTSARSASRPQVPLKPFGAKYCGGSAPREGSLFARSFEAYLSRTAAWQTRAPSSKKDQKYGCVAPPQTTRALRKWIANCKPVDRLAILHVLRGECSGASMKRSCDDE